MQDDSDAFAGYRNRSNPLNSTEAARLYWRKTILSKAQCPMCSSLGFYHALAPASAETSNPSGFTFVLPASLPPDGELVGLWVVQHAMCGRCGYIAQFLDAAIQNLYNTEVLGISQMVDLSKGKNDAV